jgi:hypothetical protein
MMGRWVRVGYLGDSQSTGIVNSSRMPHFQTHKYLGMNKNLKSRMNLLAKPVAISPTEPSRAEDYGRNNENGSRNASVAS